MGMLNAPALSFIRGVNLGATFVPEKWMVPSFYSGTSANSLCSLVRLNRTLAAERMRRHLDTFVTEEDFIWLSQEGFNAVRVPLGHWNAIEIATNGIPYVPISLEESHAVLDRLFKWAKRHGLAVLLDLHGGAGSQNGVDHSGCDTDGIGWSADEHDPQFIEKNVVVSLNALDALARRYGQHPAFLGIELLNEPAWAVEWSHGTLLDFYARAYKIVRKASPTGLVVFNVLFWDQFPAGFGNWWEGQFVEPGVVLDLHLYDCFGNASQKTLAEHVMQAQAWKRAIDRFQANGHAVMIGEWSLASGVHEGGQAWATAQLDAFSSSLGWFFWTLKKEDFTRESVGDDFGGDTWSVRGAVKSGITGLGATRKEMQRYAAMSSGMPPALQLLPSAAAVSWTSQIKHLLFASGAVFFALLSFVAWQLIGKRRRERASVTAALPPASGLLQALSAAPAACLASLEAESDHEYVRMVG